MHWPRKCTCKAVWRGLCTDLPVHTRQVERRGCGCCCGSRRGSGHGRRGHGRRGHGRRGASSSGGGSTRTVERVHGQCTPVVIDLGGRGKVLVDEQREDGDATAVARAAVPRHAHGHGIDVFLLNQQDSQRVPESPWRGTRDVAGMSAGKRIQLNALGPNAHTREVDGRA